MIQTGEIARAVSTYMHRRPGEALLLSPLWQTLAQHAKTGVCVHPGTCPVVKISPVVVDERRRMLMIAGGRGQLRFPEADLTEGFDGLGIAAATLARALGIWQPWVQPGCEEPIHLDAARADPQDGHRTRVAVRYLFRTHADLCQFAPGAPQTWVPLAEVEVGLARRVDSFLAEAVA